MTLPMVGSWPVVVHAARPFAIHGDQYFELDITRTDEEGNAGFRVRVPSHAFEKTPTAGDRLVLAFLMGQVTSAKLQPKG